MPQLRAATHKSNKIVGDVIKHYLKYAEGKLGVTFAVDIEGARELVIAYRKAGVSADLITAKTPIGERAQLMKQFRNRKLLQLVSVDCLGEGVDVPAIEVVSMVRKTASFQLYAQQFGRGLRVMAPGYDHRLHEFSDEQRLRIVAESPKPHALILDHVGNFMHFANKGQIVDAPQDYKLTRTESERAASNGAMTYKICYACAQPFEAYRIACPHCGTVRVPAGRGSPEAVDGDLIELDGAVLARLRGEIKRVDGVMLGPAYIQRAHLDRQRAQAALRHSMRIWGGWREHVGESERESHKRFFITFGVDVLTAQALGSPDAAALQSRIAEHLLKHNITEAV